MLYWFDLSFPDTVIPAKAGIQKKILDFLNKISISIKKSFLLLLLKSLCFFLLGCFGTQQILPSVTQDSSKDIEEDSRDYDTRIQEDPDREDVIEKSAEVFSGGRCSAESEDHECKSYCQAMFKRQEVVKDCERLNTGQIQALFALYDLLENPKQEALEEEGDVEIFDLFLNVSMEGFDHLITEYSTNDAEEVLLWLIKKESANRVFVKEDRRFKTLKALLKKLKKFSSGTVYGPFIQKIHRKTLMEIAIDDSEYAVKWFHDFINETNSYCDKEALSRKCFAIYCRIGKALPSDSRKDWMHIEEMNDYIEDIIGHKVNSQQGEGENKNSNGWIHDSAPGSSYDQIGRKRDIRDWKEDLCQGLENGRA